jgi:hypothetical protein
MNNLYSNGNVFKTDIAATKTNLAIFLFTTIFSPVLRIIFLVILVIVIRTVINSIRHGAFRQTKPTSTDITAYPVTEPALIKVICKLSCSIFIRVLTLVFSIIGLNIRIALLKLINNKNTRKKTLINFSLYFIF